MQKDPLLDLVIIGAQKSYTTSLLAYLGEHPSIIAHPQQEMAYFMDDKEYQQGYKKALTHYYRGIEHAEGKKILAKNAILYTSEEGIKRLHEHNPNCKLVISLRNPVDRSYSAYLMEYNYADIDFPFSDIKNIAEKADTTYWPYNLFVEASNYARYLKMIYKYFPKDQVMVILCEELKENPIQVCQQVFKWIGIDDTFAPTIKVHNPTMKRGSKAYAKLTVNLLKRHPLVRKMAGLVIPTYYNYKIGNAIRRFNKTHKKYGSMDSATRKFLVDYYRDANKELEEMTGKRVTTFWNK
jgi:Sulfotransferase domain